MKNLLQKRSCLSEFEKSFCQTKIFWFKEQEQFLVDWNWELFLAASLSIFPCKLLPEDCRAPGAKDSSHFIHDQINLWLLSNCQREKKRLGDIDATPHYDYSDLIGQSLVITVTWLVRSWSLIARQRQPPRAPEFKLGVFENVNHHLICFLAFKMSSQNESSLSYFLITTETERL